MVCSIIGDEHPSIHDFDMDRTMESLSAEGRIFTSEADFQFSLAWTIKELYPFFDVRLEETFVWDPDKHFDIVLHSDGEMIPIELKYCTKRANPESAGGVILKNQGAEDIRRYDFIKDIQRVESVRGQCSMDPGHRFLCGYVIMLTNSSLFWKRSGRNGCCDDAFRIHEGRRIGGVMEWSDKASSGTKKGREDPIETDYYDIVWNQFRDEPDFRYVVIRVGR